MLRITCRSSLVGIALGSLSGLTLSAPLNLAQSPPGAAREPAPNIIVSVDDSGSMGAAGIATLKDALTQTFSAANLPDDRVRLAWQSMNRCSSIPNTGTACGGLNGMRSLSGTHRTNFLNWVGTLSHDGGTPGHLMMSNAGDYLSGNLGINSPWAASPGIEGNPVLACRKAFHIFMTDGGWNSGGSPATHVDTAGNNASTTRIARGGNADGTATTLPDGTVYNPTALNSRLYADSWGNSTTPLSTISDLAFFYWSRDLQPGMANNVRKSPKDQLPSENFGSTANPANVDSYWNPRNNPATWQNMVTYTIGFNNAATWTGSPTFGGDTFTGLAPLIRGETSWPTPFCNAGRNGAGNLPCDGSAGYSERTNERKTDLWHAALNSRGRFVPAPNAQALVSAFEGILGDILNQTSNPLVSIASSSSRLRANGLAYVAGFNSERWSGQLGAYAITAGTNAVAATPTWLATTLLDSTTLNVGNRLVLTSATGSTGASFVWDNLTTDQKSAIQGGDSTTVGQNRVNYLRGDRTQEVQNGGSLRRRDSRLGDIVNSNIWQSSRPLRMAFAHAGHSDFRTLLAARPSVLYVGANDGMLHAFNAATGQELLAYVPLGAYSSLRDYTLPSYGHKTYVDGHPFTGDADTSGSGTGNGATPAWKTLLVSGMGAGGRGYFVLDVTVPPGTTTTTSLPTTFTTNGVVLDKTFPAASTATFTGYEDVGHILALPVLDAVTGNRSEQIVQLNNGRWAVVMGNGINSVNERPVLLIQYLDASKELLTIVANSATSQGNGLSAPRLIDVNGDGKMDLAYAGDLQGNLWKFNLASATDGNWGVSNWNGSTPCKNTTACSPLYVAQDTAGGRQPITAAPIWISHPRGGIQILFGTGRNVTEQDRGNTSTQTIYAVWDKSTYTVTSGVVTAFDANNITTGRAALVQQSVVAAVRSTADGVTTDSDYFNTTENNVAYSRTDNTAKRGWYFDLPASRERVLGNPQIFEGQKALIGSSAPKIGSAGETCDFDVVTDDNWINVFNMITGRPATSPVFAAPNSSMNMAKATRKKFGGGEFISINNSGGGLDLISFKNDDPSCPAGQLCTERKTLTTGTATGARADWREVR